MDRSVKASVNISVNRFNSSTLSDSFSFVAKQNTVFKASFLSLVCFGMPV